MKRLAYFLVAAFATVPFAGSAAAQSGGGFDLDWNIADAGGGETSTGGSFSLVASGAMFGAGVSSGGVFASDGGFYPGVCSSTITPYGTGCAGTGGFAPQYEVLGCIATDYSATTRISNALGGQQAFIFIGVNQAALGLGAGCFLRTFPILVGPVGPIGLSGGGPGAGQVTFTVVIPPIVPSIVGGFTAQALVTDPGSLLGFTTTNGVAFFYGA